MVWACRCFATMRHCQSCPKIWAYCQKMMQMVAFLVRRHLPCLLFLKNKNNLSAKMQNSTELFSREHTCARLCPLEYLVADALSHPNILRTVGVTSGGTLLIQRAESTSNRFFILLPTRLMSGFEELCSTTTLLHSSSVMGSTSSIIDKKFKSSPMQ